MGQKRPETGLLEVAIGREGFPQIVVSHNDKRDAIRQRPLLVLALCEEVNPPAEEILRGRDDGHCGV